MAQFIYKDLLGRTLNPAKAPSTGYKVEVYNNTGRPLITNSAVGKTTPNPYANKVKPTGQTTPNPYANKVQEEVITVEPKPLTQLGTYDTTNAYNHYLNTAGYSDLNLNVAMPEKTDISGLLAAFEQEAKSSRNITETNYNNTRSDLLRSIERFREQNALDREAQNKNYLSQQAALEAARESANRQSRIANAARGLSGSGLQQLAQLNNLINQGGDISKAATENQVALDKLRTLLAQGEEDYASDIKEAESARANALEAIESELSSKKASAIAENERDYTNAVNEAKARAAAAQQQAASMRASAQQQANALAGAYQVAENELNAELKKVYNATNKDTIRRYGAEMGIQINDLSSASKVASAKQAIAKAMAEATHQTLSDIQNAYQVSAYDVNQSAKRVNQLLNSYGFYNYYRG